MDDFYLKISRIKEERKLTNSDLGTIIDKKPDAFRIALKRESLSKLEIERLENHFAKTEQNNTQVESLNDRFEDIVAKKVMDLMDARWKNSEKYDEIIVFRLAKQTEKMELMQIYLERMRQTLEQFEKTLIKEAIEIRKNLK